jgi:hypothetical protein
MSRFRSRRVAMLAAGCAAALSLAGGTNAAADNSAIVDRFNFTFTETFDTTVAECFVEDLVGTTVNTVTIAGQVVETSGGVFHVGGTETISFRWEAPNGMYADGTSNIHFSFTTNGSVVVDRQMESNDRRTIYASDGTPIGQVVFHAFSLVTFHDLNDDGEPQADEISASVDTFFFTCH